jgi:UPF0755 protein
MSSEYEQYRALEPEPRWPRYLKGIAVVALIVIGFGGAYVGVKALADWVGDAIGAGEAGAVEPGLTVSVEIPTGASAGEIAVLLADAGVVDSAAMFEREVQARRVAGQLRAGSYELVTGMDVDVLIGALTRGPASGAVYRITVIEGLTVAQTLESLERQTGFSVEEFEGPLLDGTVTSDLMALMAEASVPGAEDEETTTSDGDTAATTTSEGTGTSTTTTTRDADTEGAAIESLQAWEGLLWPDTYEIAQTAGPASILQLLADTAEERVGSVDWDLLVERGYTVYDGIVIASMIEREARLDDERALVASVIFNRLDQDIPLQIDATIVYVLGGAPEGLTLDDLEIDSPYNTYRNLGLPPTPIAGPRLASLRAAAAPAATDYLYYVLIDASGQHAFTGDFDEFLDLQQQAREAGLIP